MEKNKKKENKVLIIEDDQFLAKMLEQVLSCKGYSITRAANGSEGLEQSLKGGFGLIILDIILPDYDGFELLDKIRHSQTAKKTPVLIISNLGQEEDVQHGLKLGANDYIIKSDFSLNDVVAKVKKYF